MDSRAQARKIAMDHLKESPNYYKDWKKKEAILFKEKVNPMKTKVSKAGQKRVSQKIRKLVGEGYGQKQAAAIAYKMESKHELGPRGGKKRNPINTSTPFAEIKNKRWGGRPMKVYAIFAMNNWVWIILSKISKSTPIIQMALVTSPIMPEGELGSVYKADLEHVPQLGRDMLEKVLPPDWEIVKKIGSNPFKDMNAFVKDLKETLALAGSKPIDVYWHHHPSYERNGAHHPEFWIVHIEFEPESHFAEKVRRGRLLAYKVGRGVYKGQIKQTSVWFRNTVMPVLKAHGLEAMSATKFDKRLLPSLEMEVKEETRFKTNPIPKDIVTDAIIALSGMLNYPHRVKDVNPAILAALEAEGYWNPEVGVTLKGENFLIEFVESMGKVDE